MATGTLEKVNICPLKSVTTMNCSQVKTLVRMTSTKMNFPKTVPDSLCRNYLFVQTHSFASCPGFWSQMIPPVKKPAVEVLGWRGYTWSVVVRHCQILLNDSQFSCNSSSGHSCCQHANCT